MKKNKTQVQMGQEVFKRLHKEWPDAHCELYHETPFQLLIATILSAQCTDVRVNMVTPKLFKKYPTPKALASANLVEVEEIIKSTNFYRNKAKNIVATANILQDEFKGEVPPDMDSLVKLPGVGRKTANVVLGNAFNINIGVVVDTHVKRISNLLKLTKSDDPIVIEQDLMKKFSQDHWTQLSHLMIFLGRRICIARNPKCEKCMLNDICPSSQV